MLGTASIDKIYDNLDNTIEWKTTDADSNRAVVMAMDSGGPVFNAQGELVGVNCCASVKKAQAGGWVADSVVSNITTGPSTEFISSQLSGSSPGPGGTPAPSSKPGGPSVGGFTCEQQKAWGKCNEAWMHPVCDSVCNGSTPGPGGNPAPSTKPGGTPAPSTKPGGPSVGGFTCEQQKAWGKCKEAWMHPVCDSVCNGG
jgi:hypothetical protein